MSSELGDGWSAAYAGFMLGNAFMNDDPNRARQLLEASARAFRTLGDHHSMLLVRRALATIAAQHDRKRARALYEDNLRIARETANPRIEASTLGALATIAVDEGRLDDALAMLEESLRLHQASTTCSTPQSISAVRPWRSHAETPTAAVRILASFQGLRWTTSAFVVRGLRR